MREEMDAASLLISPPTAQHAPSVSGHLSFQMLRLDSSEQIQFWWALLCGAERLLANG